MGKKDLFTKVPLPHVQQSHFDLSHEVKMSGKFGFLYPVLCMETLPGDYVTDQMVAQVRFAPMLAPIMHRVDVKTDFFFVPNRLLVDSWEDFITGGQDGLSEATIPWVTPGGLSDLNYEDYMAKGTLWDYLGLPVWDPSDAAPTSTEHISALPFRAYTQIWNDWFRDPNLDDEANFAPEQAGNVDGNISTMGALRRRGWERDYFTSALPWAQRGPTVLLPLTMTAGDIVSSIDGLPSDAGTVLAIDPLTPGRMGTAATVGPITGFEGAELEIENTQTTINDFRRSLAIQKWMENNAIGGGRYIEQIEQHFRVRVPDYRLQRSEYLGGGRQPVVISEVLSTANTEAVPVGDMAGHGISVGKTNRFKYSCKEHGFIIGILTIVPRTAYQQGIPRLFTRNDKFDFAFPELANIGEQEIVNKEVFYSFDIADDPANNVTFGYIPRYAEYKFMQDRIAGDFRDNLAFWHLGRIFTSRPSLDSLFVTMWENDSGVEDSYSRIFAVQESGSDYLWIQLFHRLGAKRPLPYFGVPQLNG